MKFNILKVFFLLLICIVLSFKTTTAQLIPRITNTQLDYHEDQNYMVISYDIVNAQPTDRFEIWLEIKTHTGRIINATAILGDIGINITGGTGKRIVWDMQGDSINSKENIYVFVRGKPINPEAASTDNNTRKKNKTREETNTDNYEPVQDNKQTNNIKDETNEENTIVNPYQNIEIETEEDNKISMGSAILMSAVVPGLGLTKMEPTKPYWLMGLATYGCLGASVYYNRLAVDSYDSYLASNEEVERASLCSDWEYQNNVSKGLAIGAAIIWAADMIWVIAKTSKQKSDYYSLMNKKQKGIFLGATYDEYINQPLLSLTLKF